MVGTSPFINYLIKMGLVPPAGVTGQGALPLGDYAYQNSDFMSMGGADPLTSSQSVGASAAGSSPSGGGPGYGNAAAAAAVGALQAKDVGQNVKNAFATQAGVDPDTLANAPHFLSKKAQQEHAVANAAANLIPGVGPIVSAGLGAASGAKTTDVANRYFEQLFKTNPETKKLGLEVPMVAPDKEELVDTAIGGKDIPTGIMGGAAKGATLGTIVPGLGNVVGAVVGGAVGGLLGGRSAHKAKEREKKMKQIAVRNAAKYKNYQDAASGQGAATDAIRAALDGTQDPATQYILQLLANRAPATPQYKKVS